MDFEITESEMASFNCSLISNQLSIAFLHGFLKDEISSLIFSLLKSIQSIHV